MSTKHTPENTVLWRDRLQPSPGTVPVPAGSPVIRDGRRVRLDRTEHAWVFTIPSSRAALGVPDHSLTVALDGSWAICSCGSCVNRDRCTLVDNPRAVLAHHGLLPGQAEVRCPECGYRCELIAQDDGEPGDEWRWTCYACETAWPAGTLPVAPADPGGASACRPCWHCPTRAYCAEHGCRYGFAASAANPGGAVGEPPELAGLTACEDAARDTRTLDALVAAGGDRWIASLTHAGIRLTCATCHDVRGWATETDAVKFLVDGGVCSCRGAGPIPPAQGAARKPLRDHLDVLYGE